MTWKLVPEGMHRRNMNEKQHKLSKDILNLFFVGLQTPYNESVG